MSCSPVRYNPGQCIRFTHVYNLFVPMAIFVKPNRLVLLESQHVFERIPWEVMHAIRERVAQEEPVLQGIDRSSSSNSSVRSSFGSGPSLLSRLKKWGYSIFSMNLSATLRDSEVEDIRISHRRRVNRHTAPTEHPRFVIIGNTRVSKCCNFRLQDAWYGAALPHLEGWQSPPAGERKIHGLVLQFCLLGVKGCWGTGRCPKHIPWGRQDQLIEDLCCIYCLGR